MCLLEHSSILDMEYTKVLEAKCENLYLVNILGHYWILSLIFPGNLFDYKVGVGKNLEDFILSSLVSFNPAIKASYSAWLFVMFDEKQSTYLVTTPSKFVRMNPGLLPWKFETPSIWRIKVDSRSGYSIGSSSSLSCDHVHSTKKSAKIWAFTDDIG